MPTPFSEAISRAPLRFFSIATFVICMIVLVADGMDAQLLGIVAPMVIEEYGIDRGTFGWAMGAALVGFGIGSWGGGWLGDRMGRRWSLALATLVFSLATVGASWAGDVWEMAAWRLAGGLGFGSAYANAIALASEWLPDRWRSVGVTTLSVGTPAGGVVVGLLAPTLIETYDWRGSFVFIGLATLLVIVLIVGVLRDSPSFLLARGRNGEAHAVARKVLDGEFALEAERHHSDRDGAAVGVFDASNFRLNLGVGLSFIGAALCAYAMLSWATTFLTAKGFDFDAASYAVSFGGATSIAASIAAGLLVQHFGSRAVMFALSASLLATLAALALVLESLPAAPGLGDYYLVVGLYGLAAALFSAAIASLYAIMTHGYPPACRSAGIGFGIFVGRIGAVSANLGGGWLLDLGEGSVVPFFVVLAVAAVLVSASAVIVDRQVPPSRKA